jgi:hypothetical protein
MGTEDWKNEAVDGIRIRNFWKGKQIKFRSD